MFGLYTNISTFLKSGCLYHQERQASALCNHTRLKPFYQNDNFPKHMALAPFIRRFVEFEF